MRILTVRQPWAWAIIHGGKDVENRIAANIAGDYRGPVAIHVALSYDHGWQSDALAREMNHSDGVYDEPQPWRANWGKILGVVDLVGAHRAFGDNPGGHNSCGYSGQCSDWAEPQGWHLEVVRPRALAEPIPYRGALGLRRLDDDTTARILAQIGREHV